MWLLIFFPPGLNYAIWAATTCMLFELWMKLNDLGKNIDKHYSSIGQLCWFRGPKWKGLEKAESGKKYK